MQPLTRDQLDYVAHYLQQTNPHQALQAELLDHLASQIEQRLAQGHDFPTAFGQVVQQASPQALTILRQAYYREISGQPSRVGRRSKRRPTAKPLQYMLLASIFTFLSVLLCLFLITRPFAVPGSAFGPVSKVALLALLSVLVVRGWLTRRRRKPGSVRAA